MSVPIRSLSGRSVTAMPDRDYYETLGVTKASTPEQIKKAYRGLARKHHPDVNPGDKKAEGLFKEVQKAYDILSDAEKKKLYDQFGMAAFDGAPAGGPRANASEWSARHGGGGGGFENIDLSSFFNQAGGGAGVDPDAHGGSIFEELIGRVRGDKGSKRRGTRQPRPVEVQLTIPFLTAVRGGETSFDIQREDGHRESLVVKVPPGVETGSKLRLRGQGEEVPGGTRGDLTVLLTVASHGYFTREGRNLLVEVPISLAEAALGAKIEVPTLEGLKTMPIPGGTSSGQKLRLRGQGVPEFKETPAGDLFVVVKIVVPKSIDDESRRLIEEFAERNPSTPRTGLW
jgi:curved DNA-binding protein